MEYNKSVDVARPAHLRALIAARPRIRDMIRDAQDVLVQAASAASLDTLDDSEKLTAHHCLQKAAQEAEPPWQQIIHGHSGSSTAKPRLQKWNKVTSQPEDDGDEIICVPARNGRLNGPQLQAQLSRLSDRTRLRRLQSTLLAKEAWHQVTRNEDLCHTNVSHQWLYHSHARAASVSAPHDFVINKQKRTGSRSCTGEGGCRLCGTPLDRPLEHGETCSTAEATRSHAQRVETLRSHHRTPKTFRSNILTG